MGSDTYSVAHGSEVLARGMSLDDALLFVRALLEKHWVEASRFYTVVREPREINDV